MNIPLPRLSKGSCFLTLTLLMTGPAYAQNGPDLTDGYSFKHYTDENGLPQNSVKDIAPDLDGFVWLTTENGLVRFDGKRFKIFNKSNLDISTNRLTWFQPSMEKKSDRLYALTSNTEFFRIQGGRVSRDNQYYKKYIARILDVEKGLLKILLPVNSPDIQRTAQTRNKYIVPISHETGRYYLYYSNKIEFFDNWKKKSEMPVGFSDFWYIFRSGNNLMSLNKNGTVTKFDVTSDLKTTLKIQGDILLNSQFSQSPGKVKLYWNNTTDQTFLYINQSLYRLESGHSGNMHTRLLLKRFDLEAMYIQSIYYDQKHRRLFLGSHSNGLYICQPNIFSTAGLTDRYLGNVLYGHTSIDDSTIVTPRGYKIVIQRKPFLINKIPIFTPLNLYLLTLDAKKYPWGVFENHLYKFSPDARTILKHWDVKHNVFVLFYEKKSKLIWMATEEGKIYSIDPMEKDPSPVFFFKGPASPKWLEKIGNTLWIGSPKGLYNIDPDKKKTRIIQGTENLNVRSLHVSSPGEIWFTTYENGFFLYRNNVLVKLPSDKNHFLDTSHCILEDKNGYFWITTNKGLFQVSKSELLRYAQTRSGSPYYHYYSRESGFKTNEFNGGCQPCALRLGNGYVSLPSMNDLVLFVPEKTRGEQPVAKLFIDDVRVGDKAYRHTQDSVNLPVNPTNIRIQIATPYFGDPNNLNIFYAIGGSGVVPNSWVPLNDDRVIQLSSLPAGNHVLHVKKQNGFGINNYTHASFSIIVQSAWYERLWFRGLVTACLLTLVVFFIQFQNRNLIRKNKILEDAVEKRTESLKQALHALKDSENELGRQLRMQSRMIASLTHDVRSPLYAVTNISYAINAMIREEKYDLVAEIGTSIGDSTERIGTVLDSTLEYIKVQLYQKNIQFERVNLHDMVSKKILLFSLSSKKQGNRFENYIPSDLVVRNNPYLLGIIVTNLLDNANKNTTHGLISIHRESTDEQLLLKISDTGHGIPDHLIQWLNLSDQDTPEKESMYLKNGSGVGLIIVKEIARTLGLTLLAERNQTGSSVSIYLDQL